MKAKYDENNLLFKLYRKDEMERLKKRLETIRSQKPTLSYTKNTSAVNLPLINTSNKGKKSRKQN